jgi:hypothetical protein
MEGVKQSCLGHAQHTSSLESGFSVLRAGSAAVAFRFPKTKKGGRTSAVSKEGALRDVIENPAREHQPLLREELSEIIHVNTFCRLNRMFTLQKQTSMRRNLFILQVFCAG